MRLRFGNGRRGGEASGNGIRAEALGGRDSGSANVVPPEGIELERKRGWRVHLRNGRGSGLGQGDKRKTSAADPSGSAITGWALLAALTGLAVLTWASGGLDRLSLSGLAAHRTSLERFVDGWPIVAVLLYVLLFAGLTGACLPVALTLTLMGGLLLGPVVGGGATVVGATLGAILTYLAARSTVGAWMGKLIRRSSKLEEFVQRARDHPFPLMLSARLMPLFPFAPVNIAASLAGIPLRPYALATLIGAIPSSFIYSSIGAGLGRSLSDPEASLAATVSSPAIVWPLVGLALLSLMSLAVRPLIARFSPAS